jgi:HPt (histidine-containing phosphotransfer) domain-containing protein
MMSDEHVLDRGRLDAITSGLAGLAGELLEILIDEASGIAAQIRSAAPAPDGATMRELAHRLNGLAGNVGAKRLQRAAEDLERADVVDAGTLRIYSARLERELAALIALR